jgi:hypothetical protein
MQRALCCIRTRRDKRSSPSVAASRPTTASGVGRGRGSIRGSNAQGKAKMLPLTDQDEQHTETKHEKKRPSKAAGAKSTRAKVEPSEGRTDDGQAGAVKVKKGQKAKRSYERLGEGTAEAEVTECATAGVADTVAVEMTELDRSQRDTIEEEQGTGGAHAPALPAAPAAAVPAAARAIAGLD